MKGDPVILRPRVTPDPSQARDLRQRMENVQPPADVIFIGDRLPQQKLRRPPKLRLVR